MQVRNFKCPKIFTITFLNYLTFSLDHRNKAEIHSKRADLAKEKLMEVMRCYEQKLQSQSIDIQRLQEAHTRLKSEQNNCQTMHQQPELVVESLKERQRYR